jgi:hypothetical protein
MGFWELGGKTLDKAKRQCYDDDERRVVMVRIEGVAGTGDGPGGRTGLEARESSERRRGTMVAIEKRCYVCGGVGTYWHDECWEWWRRGEALGKIQDKAIASHEHEMES